MRTLVALSELTGEDQYKQAAMNATAYMFDHHQYESGLLPWGGHRFLDLKTLDDVYGFDTNSHELKRHFPYYDLMFEVDKESATQLVRGFWESHIYDWSNEFYHNRHGQWVDTVPEDIWDRSFSDPDAHQVIDRGTMVHTSNDLMYAAVHSFSHNPNLNLTTRNAEPEALLSFLELYQALEESAYLEMAKRIAENILAQKFHNGFFVQSDEHAHVRFDDSEPFALLSLVAVLRGKPEAMPLYANGSSYIHGRFDGEGRTYDHQVIWSD